MNIILIHGSWHGAWCWHKVVPLLRAAGHTVLIPDLPAHGRDWRMMRGRITLAAMTTSVSKLLDRLTEPAMIVAHSRGGIIAANLAERHPDKIQSCVYLAAYMLRDGERVADYFRQDKTSLVRKHLQIQRSSLTDSLPEEVQRATLYADCDEADVELARSLLTAEPSLPALTRLDLSPANYGRVPRHYIQLTQDRAVTPELQSLMIANSPCASVTTIDASHSAYFSRPVDLADAIDGIANPEKRLQ
nr:alpha/beta fold hydrolase [uncultured Undibacterium sp.]